MAIPTKHPPISLPTIEQAMNDLDPNIRIAALYLCNNIPEIPPAAFERWLLVEPVKDVMKAIAEACSERHFENKVIRNWLERPYCDCSNPSNNYLRLAAITSHRNRDNIPFELIGDELQYADYNEDLVKELLKLCKNNLPNHLIAEWIKNHLFSSITRFVAIQTAYNRSDISPYILELAISKDEADFLPDMALNISNLHPDIPQETIIAWFRHDSERLRMVATACIKDSDNPQDFLLTALADPNSKVAHTAAISCKGVSFPDETLRQWIYMSNFNLRHAALQSCQRADAPVDVVIIGLRDEDHNNRALAASAVSYFPTELCEVWTKHPMPDARRAAWQALFARAEDEEAKKLILKKIKTDPFPEDMRGLITQLTAQLATSKSQANSSKTRRYIRRDFEPKGSVYQKCLGGVIVSAIIPADAEIHAQNNGESYCASKAIIAQIIGSFYGAPIGLAANNLYRRNPNYIYLVGDKIEISNFPEEPGFRFFPTLEAAQSHREQKWQSTQRRICTE